MTWQIVRRENINFRENKTNIILQGFPMIKLIGLKA